MARPFSPSVFISLSLWMSRSRLLSPSQWNQWKESHNAIHIELISTSVNTNHRIKCAVQQLSTWNRRGSMCVDFMWLAAAVYDIVVVVGFAIISVHFTFHYNCRYIFRFICPVRRNCENLFVFICVESSKSIVWTT